MEAEMKSRSYKMFAGLAAVIMAISACALPGGSAIQNAVQGGGPKIVTGKVTYTNSFFTSGVAEPEVILEDEGGFVTRNRKFLIPVQSQVIGEITSDFYTSPFTYSLSLPAEPNGTLHDVAHDGNKSKGVMVFAVAYWTNTWGDPYLEKRDQGGGGWSSDYASTKVSDNRDTYLEVYGGKYLVYAPDDTEQFPSGFGADKKLFTDDDPLMKIQAGWSVVNLDANPFSIDRSEKPSIDLFESTSSAMDDFSKLSYTQAFDKMVDKFTKQYAWTELKKIDWSAKTTEFRPRFADAEKANDPHAYALALRDFLWSIPDTHVGFDESLLQNDFQTDVAGGLGFGMRDTDDGKIIASFITKGGAAEQAGMKWGAEILTLDGKPTNDVVSATVPWSSPFSNPIIKRLQQLRYATRFKLDKGTVSVKFQNPGGSPQTANLTLANETDSFSAASFYAGQPQTSLPVEFSVLPDGYGYIKISSFLDNDVLSIQVWERAIKFFNDNKVPGVIIDMRHNGGGSGWLADQMAAYFFDKETVVGNTAYYNKGSGTFYMDPGDQTSMIPPPSNLQYSGPVEVMVGPACASACEFFSYDMTINNRAKIVGQYPSDGAGGSVEDFMMPESIQVQLTIGRAVDANGNIHLEGKGAVPTVKVPVTADTLLKQYNGEDVVLEAAEAAFGGQSSSGGSASTGPLPPASGPPTMASKADAATALSSNTPYLESKAKEQYSAADQTKPGTLTYTVSLNPSDQVIWTYSWCTTTSDILTNNLKSIKLKFKLDGKDVPVSAMQVDTGPNGTQECQSTYTALSNWPTGSHHLTTTATFTTKINDGTSDYAAGDYVLDYTVNVQP
jgi:C-terminal processing protease CtpA/Prc